MTAEATERSHLSAHFVGSMPLSSCDETFRTISAELGRYLKRLPDGETGGRSKWVGYVGNMLETHPDFEVDSAAPVFEMRVVSGRVYRKFVRLKFKDGIDPATVRFDPLYAEIAAESFRSFDALQTSGVIPKNVRFQVCLPTPLAITYNYISPSARSDFIRVYSDHILSEVMKLSQAIPPERLSVQWDVLQEVLMFEDFFGEQHPSYREEIFGVLSRMGNGVPEAIELGYHFCYGSPLDEHLVLPRDMSLVVELMNGVTAAVRRPIQYFHIPVPKDRTDEDYYAPLRRLKLQTGTELYLGLIHEHDDLGNRDRLAAAQKFCTVSGVATECGLGRAERSRIAPTLKAYQRLLETQKKTADTSSKA